MDPADYHYELPDELIARYPCATRSDSRLMVLPVDTPLRHARFVDLPAQLREGDLLIVNDTRVVPARLFASKSTGGRVEILLERVTGENQTLAHIRASKSPRPGAVLTIEGGATAVVLERSGELYCLRFDEGVDEVLDRCGHVPLPPYLQRDDEPADRERYQTVFARDPGAVAAPTAGLHFDAALIDRLAENGIGIAPVTLHVGAGTFQNLRPEQLRSGRLHSERFVLSDATCERIAAARSRKGRVIAVGTTSARVLESVARDGDLRACSGNTDLFIRPGFRFRVIDALITNFHLPESSLLMLVAALAGRERILAAYREAVHEHYRFFSYGDGMLVWRDAQNSTGATHAI